MSHVSYLSHIYLSWGQNPPRVLTFATVVFSLYAVKQALQGIRGILSGLPKLIYCSTHFANPLVWMG